MAVKTATPAKKTAITTKATATRKAAPARKTESARKKPATGESLECNVCGLVVSIDEDCGCAEEHVIFCCDEPMKTRGKAAARSKK